MRSQYEDVGYQLRLAKNDVHSSFLFKLLVNEPTLFTFYIFMRGLIPFHKSEVV